MAGTKLFNVDLEVEGSIKVSTTPNVTGNILIKGADGTIGIRTPAQIKADIGLGNVDNTSDINKPISTAVQTALNSKENISNKATSFGTLNNTLYPTTQAVANYVGNGTLSITTGAGLTGSGSFGANQSGNSSVSIDLSAATQNNINLGVASYNAIGFPLSNLNTNNKNTLVESINQVNTNLVSLTNTYNTNAFLWIYKAQIPSVPLVLKTSMTRSTSSIMAYFRIEGNSYNSHQPPYDFSFQFYKYLATESGFLELNGVSLGLSPTSIHAFYDDDGYLSIRIFLPSNYLSLKIHQIVSNIVGGAPKITSVSERALTQTEQAYLLNIPFKQAAYTDQLPTAAQISNWNAAYGWGNHSEAGYLQYKGSVASGYDLNDLIEPGIYQIGTVAASTILNKPYALSQTTIIKVYRTATNYLKQEYSVIGGAGFNFTYTRVRNGFSNSWSEWSKIWTERDFTSTSITNWDAGYNYSQIGHLPLSGGTMSNTNLVNNLNAQFLNGYAHDQFTKEKVLVNSYATGSGYFLIRLKPIPNQMFAFKISVYQNYTRFEIDVASYNYRPEEPWYATTISLTNSSITQLEVILGYFSTNDLYIAIPKSNYAGVKVYDFLNGYNRNTDWVNSITVEEYAAGQLPGTIYETRTVYRPMNVNHPANSITFGGISNWDAAFGWGNHAGLYLPLSGGTMTGAINTSINNIINFNGSNRIQIDGTNIVLGGNTTGSGGVYLRPQGTGVSTNQVNINGSGVITTSNGDGTSSQWKQAFDWGNHASAGYAVNGTGSTQVRNNTQLDARYLQSESDTLQSVVNRGNTTTGTLVAARFVVYGAAGTNRDFVYRTGDVARWNIYTHSGAETGGNTGSDLAIARYSDTGAFLGNVMSFNRSSGDVHINNLVTASGTTSANWSSAYSHSQITNSNPHGTTFAQLNAKPTTIAGYGITDATFSQLPIAGSVGGNGVKISDTRNVNDTPSTTYRNGVFFDFKTNSAIGLTGAGTYSGVMTMVPYADSSGWNNTAWRIAHGSGKFAIQGYGTTAWGDWNEIWHSGNLSSTKFTNWDNSYTHSQVTNGNPHGTTFAQILSKPTTVSGFGITDAVTIGGAQAIAGDKTFNGAVILKASNGSWIAGAKGDAGQIASKIGVASAYYSMFKFETFGGNLVSFGGIDNSVGFAGYYKARVDNNANGTDWRTSWDTSTGAMIHTHSFQAQSLRISGGTDNSILLAGGGVKAISDFMQTSHSANGITSGLITNWNTAYNHSQLTTGNPHGTTFGQLLSRPTTIVGYGITDAFRFLRNVPTIDEIVESGIYRQELPSSGFNYTTTLNLNSGDGRQQLTIARDGASMRFRGATTGSGATGWSDWRTVWTDLNLPTSKIIGWDNAYTHSQITSGNPHGTTFAQLNSKPTTLDGYGITDAVSLNTQQTIIATKVFTKPTVQLLGANFRRIENFLNIANSLSTAQTSIMINLGDTMDATMYELELSIFRYSSSTIPSMAAQQTRMRITNYTVSAGDTNMYNNSVSVFEGDKNIASSVKIYRNASNHHVIIIEGNFGSYVKVSSNITLHHGGGSEARATSLIANATIDFSNTTTGLTLFKTIDSSAFNKYADDAQITALTNSKANTDGSNATGTWGIGISGNAASATKLATARTINGTSFDGTSNITTANWGNARTLSYTGDVTGSASVNGSANVATALTIANNAVTFTKVQNIATQRILGRGTAGTGNIEELTLGANLTLSAGGVLSATDTNTTYSAGSGLTLSGTTFSLPVTVSGSGSFVQSVAQNANGITVTLGTPPNTDTNTVTRLRGTTSGTLVSGDITLAAGSNVTITQSGNTITIGSTGGTGFVDLTTNQTIDGIKTFVKTIYSQGDIVSFSTSDRRLKKNIKPLEGALDKVKSIGGYSYEWEEEAEFEGKDVGIIAQEIEEIFPEVVVTRDNGYKAVKYEKVIPLLIEAIKELSKQVDELKNGVSK